MADYIGKYQNSILRFPIHPGSDIWGPMISNLATHKYCYAFGDNRVVSASFGYSYTVGDSTLLPVMKWLNGYCYFSGDSKYIWYSTTWSSWVKTVTAPGFPPAEVWEWDDETETTGAYTGEEWYSGTLPVFNSTSSFVARGSNRGDVQGEFNGAPIDVGTEWEYWQRETEDESHAGVYLPEGTAENDIIIGVPQFIDDTDETYVRSLEKTDGKYTYDAIYYDSVYSTWIYGTYGSDGGWWEGTEPDTESAVTFNFTYNEPEEGQEPPIGEDFIVEFDKYVIGDDTEKSYTFNVGRWHK